MTRISPLWKRFPGALAVAFLGLVVLTVFWPIIAGGEAFFYGDLELYFTPLWEFWAREFHQGRVPLWNPWVFGGVPFAGNPQISLLYPPTLLLAFVDSVRAMMWLFAAHFWWSGSGFYAWMRRGRLKLTVLPALLAASAWMLGGVLVSKTQFPNMMFALSWVPWVLWSAEALSTKPSARAAAILGGVWALQLLCGHVQIALYTAYFALALSVWVWNERRDYHFARLVLGLAGAGVLASVLTGGEVLPVWENLREASRQVLTLESAPRFALAPWAVTHLVAPYLYGNPHGGTWTSRAGGNPWEVACYVGIAPFCLAAWSVLRWGSDQLWARSIAGATVVGVAVMVGWHEPFWSLSTALILGIIPLTWMLLCANRTGEARFWLWSATASVLLAMGSWGVLYSVAYHALPGVARFHDAARWLLIAGTSVPVAGALWAGELERRGYRVWVAVLLAFTVVEMGWFARNVTPRHFVDEVKLAQSTNWSADAMVSAHQARQWSPNYTSVWSYLLPHFDYPARTREREAQMKIALLGNTAIHLDWLAAGGYDPITPSRVEKGVEVNESGASPSAAELGEDSVRLIFFWSETPIPTPPGMTGIYTSDFKANRLRLYVFRNEKCLPRARWIGAAKGVHAARLVRDTANEVELEVPATARVVTLADNFASGWKCFVDERPVPIHRTPRGWREVRLQGSAQARTQAGKMRRVRFVYRPETWRLGVFLSLCGLGMVAAILSSTGRKPKTPTFGNVGVQGKGNGRAPSL